MVLTRFDGEMANNATKDSFVRAYASCSIGGSGAPTLSQAFNVASVARQSVGVWRFTFSAGLGLAANDYVPQVSVLQIPSNIKLAFITRVQAAYVEVAVLDSTASLTDDIDGLFITVHANL